MCFFSGTDQSELHDNAPNHNYYLSLIVNYKEETESNWCAKVAYVTEEKREGTRKIITSWKSRFNGWKEGKRSSKDLDEASNVEEETFTETKEYLNLIDLELIESETPSNPIVNNRDLLRFKKISRKSKTTGYSYTSSGKSTYTPGDVWDVKKQAWVPKETQTKQVGFMRASNQAALDFDGGMSGRAWADWDEEEEIHFPKTETESFSKANKNKLRNVYNTTRVKPFLFRLLKENSFTYEDCTTIDDMSKKIITGATAYSLTNKISRPKVVDNLLKQIFKAEPDSLESHLICVSTVALMKQLSFPEEIIEAVAEELHFQFSFDECDELETANLINETDLPWEYLT